MVFGISCQLILFSQEDRVLELSRQGKNYMDQKRYKSAVVTFSEAAIFQQNPDIYYNLAICQLNLKDEKKFCLNIMRCRQLGDKECQQLYQQQCQEKYTIADLFEKKDSLPSFSVPSVELTQFLYQNIHRKVRIEDTSISKLLIVSMEIDEYGFIDKTSIKLNEDFILSNEIIRSIGEAPPFNPSIIMEDGKYVAKRSTISFVLKLRLEEDD